MNILEAIDSLSRIVKLKSVQSGFCLVLLILTFNPNSLAQLNSKHGNGKMNCGMPPAGLFRQVTGASWKRSAEDESLFFNKKSDTLANRWTLNELDEVDATYKFLVIPNESDINNSKCSDPIKVGGTLVSPTGKLFNFKRAIYYKASHQLQFSTVERDGVVYDVEVQFYVKPVRVGKMYQDGTVNLKASSKTLGTILMQFPFTSWNSE